MNSTLLTAISGSFIRWALTTLGAVAVAHGAVSADDVAAISPGLQEALGGLVSAGALAWSAYAKHRAEQASAVKETVAAMTGQTAAPVTTAVKDKAADVIAAKGV